MTNSKQTMFLSYAQDDLDFAERVRMALLKKGMTVNSAADFGPGEQIFEGLKKAINKSQTFVFFIPAFEGSGQWALAELGAARALDKTVLAVLPSRARLRNGQSLSSLSNLSYIDASGLTPSRIADKIVQHAKVSELVDAH